MAANKQLVKKLVVKTTEGINIDCSGLSLAEVQKAHKAGEVWLQRCLSEIGFTYDETFKEAKIGNLSEPLEWGHYWEAYDKIM